jgi:peptidyl-prolyl cis-trans isomerase A (cyclophilin A)
MKSLLTLLALGTAAFAQTPSLMNPASLKEQAPEKFKAKFTTTKGDFVVQVTRAWAPHGADRFYNLVKAGFFNDCSFFRIVPGFIAQVGMPADPKVGTAWQSANIPDDPVKHSNAAGTLVFAKSSAPNSRTTQLFINLVDNKNQLDPPVQQGFAPFGEVTEGMDVVKKLYSGYGDGSDMGGNGPTQDRIRREGKPYLDKNFPKLDSIKTGTIVP